MHAEIVIIGSGPAGLSAAAATAEQGREALILERHDLPSLKLLASGGGRCNFTNEQPPDAFMKSFGRNGEFMRNALRFTSREWLLQYLRENGVTPELTDHFYWFPKSGKAKDIQIFFLRRSHAEIRTSCECVKINIENGGVAGVLLKDDSVIPADAVILAAGGCAWKGLGSGAGLRIAQTAGHTIVKPLPAVAPLIVKESWPGSLAGVTLENASLTLGKGRNKLQTKGSVLFTHNGLSGFPALDLAGEAAYLCDRNGTADLFMSFSADLDAAQWHALLQNARKTAGQQSVKTFLCGKIPRSLAEIIVDLADCPETKLCQLPSGTEQHLSELLTACPLTLTGAGPMDRAMAMRGGVSLKEVDPATMESRLVHGLYFAGEILDLVGPCGGYNIQWAISSGRLAGYSAAQKLKKESNHD